MDLFRLGHLVAVFCKECERILQVCTEALEGVDGLRSICSLVSLGLCELDNPFNLFRAQEMGPEGCNHGAPILGGHVVFYPCFRWCLCKQADNIVPYGFLVLLPSWSYSNGLVDKSFSFISESCQWCRLTNHICQWDVIITFLCSKLSEDGVFPLVEIVFPKLWWFCYIQGVRHIFCDF